MYERRIQMPQVFCLTDRPEVELVVRSRENLMLKDGIWKREDQRPFYLIHLPEAAFKNRALVKDPGFRFLVRGLRTARESGGVLLQNAFSTGSAGAARFEILKKQARITGPVRRMDLSLLPVRDVPERPEILYGKNANLYELALWTEEAMNRCYGKEFEDPASALYGAALFLPILSEIAERKLLATQEMLIGVGEKVYPASGNCLPGCDTAQIAEIRVVRQSRSAPLPYNYLELLMRVADEKISKAALDEILFTLYGNGQLSWPYSMGSVLPVNLKDDLLPPDAFFDTPYEAMAESVYGRELTTAGGESGIFLLGDIHEFQDLYTREKAAQEQLVLDLLVERQIAQYQEDTDETCIHLTLQCDGGPFAVNVTMDEQEAAGWAGIRPGQTVRIMEKGVAAHSTRSLARALQVYGAADQETMLSLIRRLDQIGVQTHWQVHCLDGVWTVGERLAAVIRDLPDPCKDLSFYSKLRGLLSAVERGEISAVKYREAVTEYAAKMMEGGSYEDQL